MLQRENSFVRFVFDSPALTVTIIRDTEPTDEEWTFAKETMMQFYEAAEAGNIRLRICFDLLNMCLLPARRYTDWANLFTTNRDKTAACVHATSIVTGSVLVRTAVNAFFAVYNPVRPFRMAGSVTEALAWLENARE
jgi:hypothetical protein